MTAPLSDQVRTAELAAHIEAVMGSPVLFEPIWSTRRGRYEGFYAMIDAGARLMNPGATRQEAVESLLATLTELYPERFAPAFSVAAE